MYQYMQIVLVLIASGATAFFLSNNKTVSKGVIVTFFLLGIFFVFAGVLSVFFSSNSTQLAHYILLKTNSVNDRWIILGYMGLMTSCFLLLVYLYNIDHLGKNGGTDHD